MYCPKCKITIDTESENCPHCNTPLLPIDPADNKQNEYVRIFESYNIGLTAIIKSILINADIKFVVEGEHMQSMFGGRFSFGLGAEIGKVDFFVQGKDADVAEELLKELN
ncbi:MAG: DUF2007 domain-containing protein [Candidatus Tenebribacter davisii]|jgi:hypothetical protein|nr:DUF2007 domain-containing protein [Candidatus Tenebribacter davisii]